MTIGGLVVAGILFGVAWLHQSAWLKKFVVGSVVIWFAFYFAMLLGASLLSRERTIAVGDTDGKAFCGFYLDCHLHTAVTDVMRAKAIGNKTAVGEFYIVRVRDFSDAKNPSIAFRLLEPKARLILPDGTKLQRDLDAEALLPTAGVSLGGDIKGRKTIEKHIVFDVDQPSSDLRLLITEGYGIDKWIERFLIGDDDSIFHAQQYFAINVGPRAACPHECEARTFDLAAVSVDAGKLPAGSVMEQSHLASVK
jgi:hypothetical protein